MKTMKIVLGITGSVAATVSDKLIDALINNGHEVKYITTEKAALFFKHPIGLRHPVESGSNPTHCPELSEWLWWRKIGDSIQHIELANWMDLMLIAPLTANTMAKMANGICDNLLTSVWLAHGTKPVYVAPAMNSNMWDHPATQANLQKIKSFGVQVINPVEKKLACGVTGIGAMAQIEDIVDEVEKESIINIIAEEQLIF